MSEGQNHKQILRKDHTQFQYWKSSRCQPGVSIRFCCWTPVCLQHWNQTCQYWNIIRFQHCNVMGCCHKGVGIRRDFQLKSLARLQHCKTYTNISIMHASLLESYEPPPLESHQTPITEYDQRQSIVAFSHWYRIRFGYHPTPIITYGTDMTPQCCAGKSFIA